MQQRPPFRPPFRPIGPTSRDLMLKPGYRTNIIPVTTTHAAANTFSQSKPSPTLLIPSTKSSPSNDNILSFVDQNAPENEEEKPVSQFPFTFPFIFSKAQLQNSPSFRNHHISLKNEMILRRSGTCFIKQLTNRINSHYTQKHKQISPRASCMAMIYFHRFFMCHSFRTFLPLEMATTCLFLASKCEDCAKHISYFSNYYYQLTNDGDKLEKHEVETVNDLIRIYEARLLQTLAFEFNITLPHICVINAPFKSEKDWLKKLAWRFCADILAYTTLCLQHDENVLAAVALYVAGAYLDIDMKQLYGANWLQSIAPLLTEEALTKIVDVFLDALVDMEIVIRSKKYEIEDDQVP